MKKPILTTLSVLATAFIFTSHVCHAETTAQQREQAAINDNNTINNLSDPFDNDQNNSSSDNSDNNNGDQSNDADTGDSSSNSDDGND